MGAIFGHVSHFAAAASTALITSIWQGILFAGLVALCLRLVPRLGAAARSLVWLAVFLLVASLNVISLPISALPPATTGIHLAAGWALPLVSLWVALSLVRLTQLFAGAIRLSAIARHATPLSIAVIPTLGKAILCASPEVDRPGVFGFLSPRILLPVGLAERLSPAELHAVVLHEQEHLRRRDVWINLLQKIGLALLPLNPVLAWVERRLCRERELACDDHVLQHTRARKTYAACLAHLAEDTRTRRPLALALGLAERGSELGRRIQRILNTPHPALGPRAATVSSVALLAVLLGGSVELARCPRLIAFGDVSFRDVAFAPAQDSLQNGLAAVMPAHLAPAADKPHLVQAVASMETRPAALRTRVEVHTLHRARVPRRNARPHPQWLVMTHFTEESEPALVPIRFLVPLAGYLSLSYATVPTRTGWLVFQL